MKTRNNLDEDFVAGSEDEDDLSFHTGFVSRSDQDLFVAYPVSNGANLNASRNVQPSTSKSSPIRSVIKNTTVPKPRPRPRPAYNGAPGFNPDQQVSSRVASDLITTPPVQTTAIELLPSTEVVDDFSPSIYSPAIAERAKDRSRTAKRGRATTVTRIDDSPIRDIEKLAPLKMKQTSSRRPAVVSSVIEITSDEEEYDELALRSSLSSKSKTKRQLQETSCKAKKRSKVSDETEKHSPSSEDPTTTISPHISTFHNNATLPPSDPPSSFTFTLQEPDHPPIAVLPSDHDTSTYLDLDTIQPLSSPPLKMRKRRKLGGAPPYPDHDLVDDVENGTTDTPGISIRIPPSFFASSSQSDQIPVSTPSDVARSKRGSKKSKLSSKAKGKQKAVDDECWEERGGAKPKSKPKPKTKSKKDCKIGKSEKNPGQTEASNPEMRNSKDQFIPVIENDQVHTEEGDASARSIHASMTAGDDQDVEEDLVSVNKRRNGRLKIVSDDEDAEPRDSDVMTRKQQIREGHGGGSDVPGARDGLNLTAMKENVHPNPDSIDKSLTAKRNDASSSRLSTKSTPMSELIRRVNSLPGSPFTSSPSLLRSRTAAATATAYSPYAKASRSVLSRIAPLHPNRRTPPPPLPRPPPPKKTKKQLELEEKWEEELSESVEGWACFTDEERAVLRRAKISKELGYEE